MCGPSENMKPFSPNCDKGGSTPTAAECKCSKDDMIGCRLGPMAALLVSNGENCECYVWRLLAFSRLGGSSFSNDKTVCLRRPVFWGAPTIDIFCFICSLWFWKYRRTTSGE